MSKEAKIMTGVIAVIVVGMIGVFAIMNKSSTPEPTKVADAGKLVRDDSHKTGTGTKVTVVEFGDFQCPACGAAEPTVERLISEYNDKATFVFRNFPLPQHKNAVIAALAAESAGGQNKYWEMHNKLYATQNDWSESADPLSFYTKYATDLGLDVNKFTSDVNNKTYQSRIDVDQADGTAVNVQGTPTFFVNGKATADYKYDTLKKAIDDALAQG
jgi:protein-disulfide isomerase